MKKTFYWASAHKPTPEQLIELGEVQFLPVELQEKLNNTPRVLGELIALADEVLGYAYENKAILVQPGGSPAFQQVLGAQNHQEGGWGVSLWYAHSERVSQDELQADGSVKKISIFKHVTFIKV